MTTYHDNVRLLDDFHKKAYNGEGFTAEEIEAAAAVWKQVWDGTYNDPRYYGHMGVMLLLVYTSKYLPDTLLDE